MTRRKKTRSLADKVTIKTGKRKDYRRWRHENPDEVQPSTRFVEKKSAQRKEQQDRKRQRQAFDPLPLTGPIKGAGDSGDSHNSDSKDKS